MELLSYGPFISHRQANEQGLRHYFTGKPCRRGHVAIRFANGGGCSECVAANNLRMYYKHNEVRKAEVRAYKAANPEKVREDYRRYRKANAEHVSKRRARWNAENPERVRAHKARARANRSQSQLIADTLRCRINSALKGTGKAAKTEELLGTSLADFLVYLELQFKPGMDWDNHGLVRVDASKGVWRNVWRDRTHANAADGI